jgi:hypothetical protein
MRYPLDLPNWRISPPDWDAATWSAAAAWVTVLIALVAAVVGLKQYRAASKAHVEQAELTQELAREQARPYVVASLESSGVEVGFMDLVVRNYGKTAARDVRMTVEPEMVRSQDGGTSVPVKKFDVLGVLAPGQEWRTYWDRAWKRNELGLPLLHEATLTYTDAEGTVLSDVLPLDWAPLIDRTLIEVRGLHSIADALRKLEKTVTHFRESPSGGLRVYARDGDAKDQREREAVQEWRAEQKRESGANAAAPEPDDGPVVDDPGDDA